MTLLLYCLCFKRLYRLGIRYWGSEQAARSYMFTSLLSYTYLIGQYPNLPEEMIKDIANANELAVLQAFDVLKSWQGSKDGWALRHWIGVDRDLIKQLFRGLGNSRCVAIAQRYLTDPYAYSKGWPDLVWIDNQTVKFSEVKTTDRLHWSQVITIPEMREAGNLWVDVVRLHLGYPPAQKQ